jgi:4-hydroxy-tetrahydrodipicolinate synthase
MNDLAVDELRGSYPPLVTPFCDGEVDYGAFARLVERQVAAGSHGIVVTGTTGEPAMLTAKERIELVRVASATAAGRLTIVAATGSQSFEETRSLTVDAVRAGADAVLVVTPYYSRPPQRGLIAYFEKIGALTEVPLLIYHIPSRAAVGLDAASVEAIAATTSTLVGIKHAAPDLGYVTDLRERLGADFRIFVGLEEWSFPMLAVGASGLMNAVGNVAPKRVLALWRAVHDGHLADARARHRELRELNDAVSYDINPIPMKYMMRRLGLLDVNEHRLPMLPAVPEMESRLDGVLRRAGLM